MRLAAALLLVLGACGPRPLPAREALPPGAIDRHDAAADTAAHPTLSRATDPRGPSCWLAVPGSLMPGCLPGAPGAASRPRSSPPLSFVLAPLAIAWARRPRKSEARHSRDHGLLPPGARK
jgi:hypothetical protein